MRGGQRPFFNFSENSFVWRRHPSLRGSVVTANNIAKETPTSTNKPFRELTNLDGVVVKDAEWRAPPKSPYPAENQMTPRFEQGSRKDLA